MNRDVIEVARLEYRAKKVTEYRELFVDEISDEEVDIIIRAENRLFSIRTILFTCHCIRE